MSPKRGDRVAPPPGPDDWDVVFGTTEAAKGWEVLCTQVGSAALAAWRTMRAGRGSPMGRGRHHQLKGSLALGTDRGRPLPQWQIEVTGGGRIWYLMDADSRRLVVVYAGTGHPRQTA